MNPIHNIILLLIGFVSIRGYAIIPGPYSVDEHTLHLYHFDGHARDAVASNALDFTLSNATANAASYSGFGTALDTFTGGNTAIAYIDEKLVGTHFTGADGLALAKAATRRPISGNKYPAFSFRKFSLTVIIVKYP